MSAIVSYADWLANYAPRQYKESTIRMYTAALEKAPERLGITLKKPIMEHTLSKEFDELYKHIVGLENFTAVNKMHGNGELSAALNAFKKYLAFLEKIGNTAEAYAVYSPEWFAAQAKGMDELRFTDFNLRNSFIEKFGPDAISELSGKELLTRLFISDVESKDNMCYMLEFHPQIKEIYGSIAGGSSFKYGLFYHKKNLCWTTGSPSKPQTLTEDEAIKVAESMRDGLVEGAKIISEHTGFDSVEGYTHLYNKLSHIPLIDNVWVLKYYQMLFPNELPVFYARNYQIDVLRFLKQEPSHIPLVRMGQIAIFVKQCGISSVEFGQIYYKYCSAGPVDPEEDETNALADNNDKSVRYWLYAPGEGSSRWDEFYHKGIMAIGWGYIGDLSLFASKADMKQKMKELNNPTLTYMNAAHATWQFAKEMKIGDVIFVKKGRSQIIGRGVITSGYEFDGSVSSEYKNIRHVNWTHKGEWPHPDGQAAMKTLTDVTPYTDYVEKLSGLFVNESDDDVEEEIVTFPEYVEADFLSDVYMDEDAYTTLVELIRAKKNVILQGAPGVGKTFAAKRLAYSMMGVKDQNRVMMIQFNQIYSNEDFIM